MLMVEDSIPFSANSSFQFTLGAGNHEWLDINLTEVQKKAKRDDNKREVPQLDFTIQLTDHTGQISALKVSEIKGITKPLKTRFTKFAFLDKEMIGEDWEVQLQTYHFPIALFSQDNPEFNAEEISAIKFIFDQCEYGVVVLDEIGVSGS